MCGIVGVLRFNDDAPPIDPARFAAMRDSMSHRGPDGHGAWLSDNHRIALGHRRLAIVDLSPAAAQPMSNADGALHLVFNGEIYNHAQLREELQQLGVTTWRTDHADTEVILHAYEQWGMACVHRFRGMFAFGLWDARLQKLWLVRDRIGVKPLYYTLQHNRLIFASEIKAILVDPGVPRRINEQSLADYLSFLTTPAPATLFAGVNKLPPGTWMTIDADGRVTQTRYWDVWDHAKPLHDDDQTITARVLDVLRESVRLRKMADVPTGVFLSGGIDSSTNAALFADAGGAIRTFSIGYANGYQEADELPLAAVHAARLGAEHHERRLTLDDLLAFTQRMAWHQDEPIADPVCVPLYYLAQMARDVGVIVCQAGEGADELFHGYPFWRTLRTLQGRALLPGAGPMMRLTQAALRAVGRGDGLACELLRRGIERKPIFWSGAEGFTHAQKLCLLSQDVLGRIPHVDAWHAVAPYRRRFEEAAWTRDTASWMTYADLMLRLPELLLARIDKMGMAAGVEGRVPYLDHELVTLVMSIPAESRFSGNGLKPLLRRAVSGVIPEEIIDRPKQGFGVPIRRWFADALGDVMREEISTWNKNAGFLDRVVLKTQLDNPRCAIQTWQLYNLALWWRSHRL